MLAAVATVSAMTLFPIGMGLINLVALDTRVDAYQLTRVNPYLPKGCQRHVSPLFIRIFISKSKRKYKLHSLSKTTVALCSPEHKNDANK